MTVPAREFRIFKEHVGEWVRRFGLVEYELAYEHVHVSSGSVAECEYDPEGKTAVFRLTRSSKWPVCGATCAKHEATHLLLGKLHWLAESRFINSKQLEDEVERIVMVLEKILV